MFDLAGKRALVTGASGAIGDAIARALAARGAIVGLSGTRLAALEALAADIGPAAHVVPADLAIAEMRLDDEEMILPGLRPHAVGGEDVRFDG